MDTSSDPHNRRVKNEIDERSIRVEREDQRQLFLFFSFFKEAEREGLLLRTC